jgi:hypothetical protein
MNIDNNRLTDRSIEETMTNLAYVVVIIVSISERSRTGWPSSEMIPRCDSPGARNAGSAGDEGGGDAMILRGASSLAFKFSEFARSTIQRQSYYYWEMNAIGERCASALTERRWK